MRFISLTGIVCALLYGAAATYVFVQDRAAPRTLGTGFASVFVVWPAVLTATLFGIEFDANNTIHMVWAILYCAVLFYFLGWFLAKVIWFLRTAS